MHGCKLYIIYIDNSWMVTVVLNLSSTKTTQTCLGFFCCRSCFFFPSRLYFRTAPNLLSFLKFPPIPFMTSAPFAINLSSYVHLHGIFFQVFSVRPSACLASPAFTLPTSRPPAHRRVKAWLLPDKNLPVTSTRFSHTPQQYH